VKGQLPFVMHPDDGTAIVAELLRDPAVLLVDGPRWKTATPRITRNVSAVGTYCMIWSPEDLPDLPAMPPLTVLGSTHRPVTQLFLLRRRMAP
jgi:hypothetical protein